MRTTIALLAFLLLGACSSGFRPGRTGLPTGTWRVISLTGASPELLERPPELTVGPDGALSGFGGVNRFSGRADPGALAAGRLEAGPLMATLMAGPAPAMETERAWLALLGSSPEWRRTGEELTLLCDGVECARLRRFASGARGQ